MPYTFNSHLCPSNADSFLKHLFSGLPSIQAIPGGYQGKSSTAANRPTYNRSPRFPRVSIK